MPLPPAPTKRSATLQPHTKDSSGKPLKASVKNPVAQSQPDLTSAVVEKKKSALPQDATDFSLQKYPPHLSSKVDGSMTTAQKNQEE